MNYQLLFIFLKFNIVILTLLKNLQERTYVWLRQKTMKPLLQPLIWCQKNQFIISVCCLKVSLDGHHSPSSMCLLNTKQKRNSNLKKTHAFVEYDECSVPNKQECP